MNYYIGANWDLDYIVQRSDFSSDVLLKVFLKPIAKRYEGEWCAIFAKVQKKLMNSIIKYTDKVTMLDSHEESVKKWFDPSFTVS